MQHNNNYKSNKGYHYDDHHYNNNRNCSHNLHLLWVRKGLFQTPSKLSTWLIFFSWITRPTPTKHFELALTNNLSTLLGVSPVSPFSTFTLNNRFDQWCCFFLLLFWACFFFVFLFIMWRGYKHLLVVNIIMTVSFWQSWTCQILFV